MSALAHFLEGEGIATAAISLVQAQSDAVGPPRVLWVPFELGRPLGEPDDAAFQRRVLQHLLDMLQRPTGPLRETFAEDAPSAGDDPRWQAPDLTGCTGLEDEWAVLAPLQQRRVAAAGRSAVGLSGLDPGQRCRVLSALPDALPDALSRLQRPASLAGFSDLVWWRFAADDHKAAYVEAALASGGRPSSRQLARWLWTGTRLGAGLQALRQRAADSTDERLALVAGRFLVPTDWR